MDTTKLTELIKKNSELRELLAEERYEELMDKLPIQQRPVLLELLRKFDAPEDFILSLQLKCGIMYGLKTVNQTVAIGAPVDGIHNVSVIANAGMKGGRQIGFLSPEAATAFSLQLDPAKNVITRVYIMQPTSVKEYEWIEVETVFGKAMTTKHALSQFVGRTTNNSNAAQQSRLTGKISRLKKKSDQMVDGAIQRHRMYKANGELESCMSKIQNDLQKLLREKFNIELIKTYVYSPVKNNLVFDKEKSEDANVLYVTFSGVASAVNNDEKYLNDVVESIKLNIPDVVKKHISGVEDIKFILPPENVSNSNYFNEQYCCRSVYVQTTPALYDLLSSSVIDPAEEEKIIKDTKAPYLQEIEAVRKELTKLKQQL